MNMSTYSGMGTSSISLGIETKLAYCQSQHKIKSGIRLSLEHEGYLCFVCLRWI
jgi:hypothetical protein